MVLCIWSLRYSDSAYVFGIIPFLLLLFFLLFRLGLYQSRAAPLAFVSTISVRMAPGLFFQSELFFAFLRSFNSLAFLLSYKGFVQYNAQLVCFPSLFQVDNSCFAGPWFNFNCSFLTSLRLLIALNSWRISLNLWRRNRVLTPSQP